MKTTTKTNFEETKFDDLHDATIRDILRRPELFFSNSLSLEEGIILLIAMRGNFGRKHNILTFRKEWLQKEMAWTRNVGLTLHETLSLTNLSNFNLHIYLLSKMVKDFDVNLYAEREFPQ